MSTGSRDAGSARTRNSEMSSSSSGSSEMTSQVQDAAEQAKQKAGEVADQAKQTTASRANEQKDKAADSLGSVARAFDDVGNQLRDQNPTMAHYADMASDKIEQFASQISNRDVTDLLGDVEDFARRNPAAFLGGAIAYAGFLAIVAAAVLLLGKAVDWWLAALIVGVLVAIIGGILIKMGLDQLKQTSPAPEQTIETLKEDKEWAKRQVS